jgi:hypothetical protein
VKTVHPGAADDPSIERSTEQGRSVVTSSAINDWRELASREADGLAVSLLWSKATDQVKVSVTDATLDEEFHINVAGPHALDAFYHPFAYAVGRGLGFGGATREPSICSRF